VGVPGEGAAAAPPLETLVPLLRDVGDLKRLRSAARTGTHMERVFRCSWAALLGGEDVGVVARRETAAALAAARMGDRDGETLVRAGLSQGEAAEVLLLSFDSVAGVLPVEARESLRDALRERPVGATPEREGLPGFAAALARQPRAGATAPGKPKIVLEPPENHAEHCAAVAVYGALVAPLYGSEPGAPFLLGLAHHLHNAVLPDSGFAGDELLGEHLDGINHRLQEEALEEIGDHDPGLRDEVSALLPSVYRTDSPEAKSFQAADVLDRVLQQDHYARAASFTLDDALGEMDLVHEGPTREFHLTVLGDAGLWR
jgi:5'-deoxynucleotidase YfbR-like HD superfamily hydrolase